MVKIYVHVCQRITECNLKVTDCLNLSLIVVVFVMKPSESVAVD